MIAAFLDAVSISVIRQWLYCATGIGIDDLFCILISVLIIIFLTKASIRILSIFLHAPANAKYFK